MQDNKKVTMIDLSKGQKLPTVEEIQEIQRKLRTERFILNRLKHAVKKQIRKLSNEKLKSLCIQTGITPLPQFRKDQITALLNEAEKRFIEEGDVKI